MMGDDVKDMREPAGTEILVCTTCRKPGEAPVDGETREGARLLDALDGRDWPEGVSVRGVECLSNCDHGCSVVLRGGDRRWTYVYGRLDAALADTLHEGACLYHGTDTGLVPWRERPVHFRKNCIARIPPLEPSE